MYVTACFPTLCDKVGIGDRLHFIDRVIPSEHQTLVHRPRQQPNMNPTLFSNNQQTYLIVLRMTILYLDCFLHDYTSISFLIITYIFSFNWKYSALPIHKAIVYLLTEVKQADIAY